MEDFKNNSIFKKRNDKRAGEIEIESFQPRLSKRIIDEIDKVLAAHYGFTEEELDFIINYDIKWLGRGEDLPYPNKLKDYKAVDKRRRMVSLIWNVLPGSLYIEGVNAEALTQKASGE